MPNIIKISNINAPELDVYARLTHAQLRRQFESERGIFIAESPKVIQLALNAGYEPVSLLMEEKHITGDAVSVINQCGDIPLYTAKRDVLSSLTGYELTRGVLCAMKRPTPLSPVALCSGTHRLAVLDGIVDSTNVGAIFRSAAALGMNGVLLTKTCCDPLCRRSIRVSMGTVFQIPWAVLPDNWLRFLKEQQFKTVAMALDDTAISIDHPVLAEQERLAIILGTEGDGLSKSTICQCDYCTIIPMYHQVDSLNVAAASAVAFWQLKWK